jgi:hypothetical protein
MKTESQVPPLRDALQSWQLGERIDPMVLMYELREFCSAEGFCYGYIELRTVGAGDYLDADEATAQRLLDNALAHSPHCTLRRYVQEDFVMARDHGLGGHLPATEYYRQLLEFPPNPYEWPDELFPASGQIMAKCRHLFFLAHEARWERPIQSDDLEFIEKYRYLMLYFAARSLLDGPIRDAKGNEVHLPEAEKFSVEQFTELHWPRYSEHLTDDGEFWVITHERPLDKGSFWDQDRVRFCCSHKFEFFWSGLIRMTYEDEVNQEEEE